MGSVVLLFKGVMTLLHKNSQKKPLHFCKGCVLSGVQFIIIKSTNPHIYCITDYLLLNEVFRHYSIISVNFDKVN